LVAVGTSPVMSFGQGYILYTATSANNYITLPLNAGTTVWAVGSGSPTQATVNTRIIEFK